MKTRRDRSFRSCSTANAAITSVVVRLGGAFRGQAIEGTFWDFRTWRRAHQGAWRLVGGSVTSAATPPRLGRRLPARRYA